MPSLGDHPALPFEGNGPLPRHASYAGARSALPRSGSQAWFLFLLYRDAGPQTDHAAAQKLGLPLATICARRGWLVGKQLVRALDHVPGPYGTVNTRWTLVVLLLALTAGGCGHRVHAATPQSPPRAVHAPGDGETDGSLLCGGEPVRSPDRASRSDGERRVHECRGTALIHPDPPVCRAVMLDTGDHEPLKLAVHGTLGALAGVCLLYNAAAWLHRREAHLALNVGLYTAILAIEVRKVAHHWRSCTPKTS